METDERTRFGREWAADYDAYEPREPHETEEAVDFLFRLAAGRSVLEVAAGTGRLALPLAERGLDVTATDISPEMVEQMRLKDTRGLLKTAVADMLDTDYPQRYGLVANLNNSIWMLTAAAEQRAAVLANAALVEPGGVLVVESVWFGRPEGERVDRYDYGPGLGTVATSTYSAETRLMIFDELLDTGERRAYTLRVPTLDELTNAVEEAGLRVRVHAGFTDAAWAPGEDAVILGFRD